MLPPIPDGELAGSRTLVLGAMQSSGQPCTLFTIDGKLFDPDRVDQTVTLGAVEEWTIENPSGWPHPFHIHTNAYALTRINGVPLPRPVWQDTTLIPAGGSITFRTRFEDFRGRFVLHCHFATHEDMGMMQVVEVL